MNPVALAFLAGSLVGVALGELLAELLSTLRAGRRSVDVARLRAVGTVIAIGGLAAMVAGPVASLAAMALAWPAAAMTRRLRTASGSRRAVEFTGPLAGAVAAGLAAGLRPVEALELACRHRRDPLSREFLAACSEAAAGRPLAESLEGVANRFPVAQVASLCTALETASRRGTDACSPVAAVARSARSEASLRRRERSARGAPLIQLVVALGLVPAALMLIVAALLARLAG